MSMLQKVLGNTKMQFHALNSNILRTTFNRSLIAMSKYKCKTLGNVPPSIGINRGIKNFIKNLVPDHTNKQFLTEISPNNNELELIYTVPRAILMRGLKYFTYPPAAISISSIPILVLDSIMNCTMTDALMFTICVQVIAAVVLPLTFHYKRKQYINFIVYDPKKDVYIAIVENIFAMEKKLKFHPNDVTVHTLPTSDDSNLTCSIKGNLFYLDKEEFKNVSYYKKIMGTNLEKQLE